MKKNKDRFVNVKVITSDKNIGVTANCNRAVKASSGQFVKTFGDDMLKPSYVEVCVNFFNSHPEAEVFCTDMEYFYPEEKFDFVQKAIDFSFFNLSAQDQKEYVRYKGIPQYPTPSMIYRKSVFDKVGFFDETIPMWEDGPIKQLYSMWKYILSSIIMSVFVIIISNLITSDLLILVVGIFTGIIIYALMLILLKDNEFLLMLKKILKPNK